MSIERKLTQNRGRRVKQFLDSVPIIGRVRKERREDREFHQLYQGAVGNVLNNIKIGGFVQEVDEHGYYEEHYWVALKGDEKKYAVLFCIDFTTEIVGKGLFFSVVDYSLKNTNRQFHIGASRVDTSKNIFTMDWTGGYMSTIERVNRDEPWEKPEKLSRKESTIFLQELSLTVVDTKATQAEYDVVKQEESPPDWLVFWVQERRQGNPLIPGNSG